VKSVIPGSTVKLLLDGRLKNGEVFDSTEEENPIIVTIGTANLIPKFEQHLLGMIEGEKRAFTIPAVEAYGLRDAGLERTLMRSELPPEYFPQVGDILAAEQPGIRRPVTIRSFDETHLVVDLNHPLAGEDLMYEVKVIEIILPEA
jgi:peptidylprolyl isomerase